VVGDRRPLYNVVRKNESLLLIDRNWPRSERPDSREFLMRIAVVIPAYNEAGNIGRLIEETIAAVPEATLQEVIVVDDASDCTGAETKALLSRCQQLRYLRHGKRAGQSAALRSGVIAATALVIATMDGDGRTTRRTS